MKKNLLKLSTAIFSTVFLSTSFGGGLADGCYQSGKSYICEYSAIDYCEWRDTGHSIEFRGCFQMGDC